MHTGDWSSGMIGVSKTFGGSSILSSPAENPGKPIKKAFRDFLILKDKGHDSI